MSHAPSALASVVSGLTPRQRSAIREAMRTFVEEDLARGVPVDGLDWCEACRSWRPSAGFVAYEPTRMCNQCATRYEILRAGGAIQTTDQFLRHARRQRRRAHRR